jgi:hypothetical protein
MLVVDPRTQEVALEVAEVELVLLVKQQQIIIQEQVVMEEQVYLLL